jgi:hypothetical protein
MLISLEFSGGDKEIYEIEEGKVDRFMSKVREEGELTYKLTMGCPISEFVRVE